MMFHTLYGEFNLALMFDNCSRSAKCCWRSEINRFSFSFSFISPAARNAQAVGGPEDDVLSNWPEAREAGSP
jgi:hypothetical protein